MQKAVMQSAEGCKVSGQGRAGQGRAGQGRAGQGRPTCRAQVIYGLCKLGIDLLIIVGVAGNAGNDPNPLALHIACCPYQLMLSAFSSHNWWTSACVESQFGSTQADMLATMRQSLEVLSLLHNLSSKTAMQFW